MTFRKKNAHSLHKHCVQDNCICCIVICFPCLSCHFCFKNLLDSFTFKVTPTLNSSSSISPLYSHNKSLIQKYKGTILGWNNTKVYQIEKLKVENSIH
jgi:hypothetical protein